MKSIVEFITLGQSVTTTQKYVSEHMNISII